MLDISTNETPFAERNEQRSGTRTATVFRPVLIESEEFAGFCLVRNLSEWGMMGHVYTSFAANLPVTLLFDPEISVAGTLQWCKDGRVGIRFEQAVDVNTILVQLARKVVRGKISRAPRLDVQCNGELIIGDRSLSIEVQDVSQRGIKVRSSFIRPGDEVFVEMSGFERRKAVVRWTQNGTAGLNFVQPLSFEQLARWVVDQQAERLREVAATEQNDPDSLYVSPPNPLEARFTTTMR